VVQQRRQSGSVVADAAGVVGENALGTGRSQGVALLVE
jgi:hypothetical protein